MALRTSEVDFEDDRIKVNRLTFAAKGDETGIHVHDFDYLVVPLSGGDLVVTAADGSTRDLHQEPGVTYTGVIGTTHNVTSASDKPVVFIEIEFKSV